MLLFEVSGGCGGGLNAGVFVAHNHGGWMSGIGLGDRQALRRLPDGVLQFCRVGTWWRGAQGLRQQAGVLRPWRGGPWWLGGIVTVPRY